MSWKIFTRTDATIEAMQATPSAAVTMCRTLLDEWFALGVEHAVVAPGSRSTPMALALLDDGRFRLHVFHDERSAAFAALGIGLSTRRPALLLCTSGTAAAEFFPAVAESSQACVPMLVCTADRPPELQGVGAPQTMNQLHLYGEYVRAFRNVEPQEMESSPSWRRIAEEAFTSSMATPCGPVHLNLQFREPLVGAAADLPPRVSPPAGHLPRIDTDLTPITELGDCESGVIVAGAGVDDPEGLVRLGDRLGWAVLADPRSGCRSVAGQVVTHADSILRHESTAKRLTPEVVLRVGEPPASKVVNQWIARCGARVVAVTPNGRHIDPDGVVTAHVAGGVAEVVAALASAGSTPEYSAAWWEAETRARVAIANGIDEESPITEPWVARAVGAELGDDEILLLSSSMPVRDVEWFASDCPPWVFSNRGVNGIDGVMSTGIGLALGSGSPVTVLIGDVAFLHDSNALINLTRRNVSLRVVVVDNRGGGIFSFLDQAKALGKDQFETLYGTPHDSDIVALAVAHGVEACEAKTRQEFTQRLAGMKRGIIVVRTQRDENVLEHQRLNDLVATELDEITPR